MLIFKKNIYEKSEYGPDTSHPGRRSFPEYYEWFDAEHLIERALKEEDCLYDILNRQPAEFRSEDLSRFFPNAHRYGSLDTLKKITRILLRGLKFKPTWFYMNTYHFCMLYDVLFRYAYNYNQDPPAERVKSLPELKGLPLHFDLFIKDYFYNTVFLMEEEKYNQLTREEKIKMGFTCPCQFAVINGLPPTEEEIQLRESKDYPYTIYV